MSPGWGRGTHPHPPRAMVRHLLHPALAGGEQAGDGEVLVRGVDGQPLDRLVDLPRRSPGDDLRLADGQFVALAAHLLDGSPAPAPRPWTSPGVGALGRQDPQRDVADQLAVDPVLTRRAVTLAPLTRPAIGEVFVPIVIEMDGSSTVIRGGGRGSSRSARCHRW